MFLLAGPPVTPADHAPPLRRSSHELRVTRSEIPCLVATLNQGLGGRPPVQRTPSQRVVSKPVLGGLHHEYRWAA